MLQHSRTTFIFKVNFLPNIELMFKNWLKIQLSGGVVPVSLKGNIWVHLVIIQHFYLYIS